MGRTAENAQAQGHTPAHVMKMLEQNIQMLGTGAALLEIELRHLPDAIAEGEEDLTLGFDQIPDLRGIFSRHALPFPCGSPSQSAFSEMSAIETLNICQNWCQYDACLPEGCKRRSDE